MATATEAEQVEGSTTMTDMAHRHRQCKDDDHSQHRHKNQQLLPSPFSYECTSENYDRAVAWCHEIITSGQQHSMALFSLHSFHTELSSTSQKFDMPFESLHSLFRNVHISYMKRTSHTLRSSTMRHVKSYLNGCSILDLAKKSNCPPTMMARLIVENVAVTTAATANASTTSTSTLPNNTNSTRQAAVDATLKKKFVSDALRHPEKYLGCASTSLLPEYLFSENIERGGKRKKKEDNHDMHDDDAQRIPLSRLSLEVRETVDSDPMYGPRHDKERHNIGIEYELLLEETLQSMDIPFETEAELRVRGTAKTPDILLSCPVGIRVRKRNDLSSASESSLKVSRLTMKDDKVIDATVASTPIPKLTITSAAEGHDNNDDIDDDMFEWKIICWIDSKALFGDVNTHNNSVLPQVETYVHRFGPGLVLYWFGHAPLSRLGDGRGDVLIVGGGLPDEFLLPTGELYGQDGMKRTTMAASKTLQF